MMPWHDIAMISLGLVAGFLGGARWVHLRVMRDDPPFTLRGKAARDFLAEMDRERTPEEIAKRKAFLEECVAIHKKSTPAPSKEPGGTP